MDNEQAAAEQPGGGGCVLFVDDEENILRALRRLFMDEPFPVLTADSGEAALKLLAGRDDLAVIVSDQRMPGMSGVELLEQVREAAPQAVRILLTGYADISAAVDSINRGRVYRYITKPWQDEELLQTVRTAVGHYQLMRENERLNALVKKQNAELQEWNRVLESKVRAQTAALRRSNEGLQALNRQQRANFKAVITALGGLLEMRNKRMRSHSQNVAQIAARVAAALELAAGEREQLVVAALLHDIGKVGLPDLMLLVDEGEMDAGEREEYEKHPIRGQAVLELIDDFRAVGGIIRHHHECFDGSGFPDRLSGEAIPLAARIIAIIDFIDKEIRGYEGDSGVELTFRKVRAEAGRRFDPQLVAAAEQAARNYFRGRLPRREVVELELRPDELSSGMVISRDVFSGTGVLLLAKGVELNDYNLGLLRRYARIDPSKRGVFVYSR